jgi:hypothetical protein
MSKTDKVKASTDASSHKRPPQKTIRRSIHQALKTKDVDDVEEIVEALSLQRAVKRNRECQV